MGTRIINRQRQMAEQGRLRLGETVPAKGGKTRPVRSETWIVTSHSEEHVHAAAGLWGGTPERWQPMGNGAEQWRVKTDTAVIDAILPPGDPLSQAYEMWSRGGCQRRCDGATEQLSGSPCVCLAQFGERWYEQRKGEVCDSKSRLKVLLPDMPGLGVWRMETGSYYGTDEIAGMVDVIREAVGDRQLVPVRLRIEQRTRVTEGETKQFVVPVLELRGVTAGALLSGHMDRQAVGGGAQDRPALERGDGSRDWAAEAAAAASLEGLRELWRQASATESFTQAELTAIMQPHLERLSEPSGAGGGETQQSPPAAGTPAPAQDADLQDGATDPDRVWQAVLAEAGRLGMDLPTVEADFAARNQGVTPETASAGELAAYLETLRSLNEYVEAQW